MLISSFIFHLRGFAPKRTEGAQARGIVAEPPAKRQRREAGDGADSPTRAHRSAPLVRVVREAARPNLMC
jgi:hypothetical protein